VPGKLEPIRVLFSKKPFRYLRDGIVQLAWRIDPNLTSLGWLPLEIGLSEQRKKEFLSWAKYDTHLRKLRDHLAGDPEWRQGPQKAWAVAYGPLKAIRYIKHKSLDSCKVLDFGCGAHFSDSTGLILYLCGVGSVDCLDIGAPCSGFESGAALDFVHWIRDQIIKDAVPALPGGLRVDLSRLDAIHQAALDNTRGNHNPVNTSVKVIRGDIMDEKWSSYRYDLITSNAVLEHVTDPPRIWSRLVDLLEAGGIMHHCIDFRDHRAYYNPLEFRPLPNDEENAQWSDPHTNGWRFKDWMHLINAEESLKVVESVAMLLDGTEVEVTGNNVDQIASCELIVQKIL
jgi:SAM-dependent methyltransferase